MIFFLRYKENFIDNKKTKLHLVRENINLTLKKRRQQKGIHEKEGGI